MDIYEIKRRTAVNQPKFFSAENMKAAGQTMKSFSVTRVSEYVYKISAPMRYGGKKMGETVRYFDTRTDDLHFSPGEEG